VKGSWLPVLQRLDRADPNPIADESVLFRCVRFRGTAKMRETPEEREARMRDLAQRLLFKVEMTNGRYTLIRTADVSRPVHEKNLTLKEAEDLLETWKLRGQGG
jgi:hypothetical protein